MNKGLSQEYVIESLMTQSAYSKFELGKSEIRASVLINILSKLDMSLEELLYITNDYKFMAKEELVRSFFEIPSIGLTNLEKILNKVELYLNSHSDDTIQNIYYLCKSYIILIKTNDFEQASLFASKIWKKLSKRNQFYVIDLYFLNAILFMFPLDVIFNLRDLMEKSIAQYNGLFKLQKIQININLNIALLLMEKHRFEEALNELETIRDVLKEEKAYEQLGIYYIRKALCLNKLNQEWIPLAEKGKLLLSAIEEFDLLKRAEQEIERWGN